MDDAYKEHDNFLFFLKNVEFNLIFSNPSRSTFTQLLHP